MGCFFACFRVSSDDGCNRPHLVSDSSRSKSRGAVVASNRLSSLFLEEEQEEHKGKKGESVRLDSPQVEKAVRDEAKFLKSCGTLAETPIEFRKASKKLKNSPPSSNDLDSSKFRSWLPNSSFTEHQAEKKFDEPPTPVKLNEGCKRESVSLDHTPSSCISSVHNNGRVSISSNESSDAGTPATGVKVEANQTHNAMTSISPWPSATNMQSRNKSVRFECDFGMSSSKGSSLENGFQTSEKFESPADRTVSKHAPKPTPLKITDEMQTPGTVFPANVELLNGKTRIRSQFVYSVSNTVDNLSQWQMMKKDDSNSDQLSGEESFQQSENETTKLGVGLKKTSSAENLTVESLSSWFKPKSTHDDDTPTSSQGFRFRRTPGDRPIIGMVAAHWNENEVTEVSPKWWDGNGIPNSTNKYKEDQKVSWHATPFEERLEKALSEESLISQKKNVDGRPVLFDEYDERDTAVSQLQASTHSKSVISC